MVHTRPQSPAARSVVSSDDEYYEVIENPLSTVQQTAVIVQEEEEIVLTVDVSPSSEQQQQQLDDPLQLDITQEIVEERVAESEEVSEMEEFLSDEISVIPAATSQADSRNEETGQGSYFSLLEAAMKHENMEAELKRYSIAVDTFNKELQGRVAQEKKFFIDAIIEIFVALFIVVMANSVEWLVPAALLIAHGLTRARDMERYKTARLSLQKELKEAFPELSKPVIAAASTVAYAANDCEAAIETAGIERSIELRKEDFSSFWRFGNSIGYVFGPPAETLGMKRGDEIVSINGINVEALSHWETRAMFKSIVAGGSCEIVVRANPELLKEKETGMNRWTIIAALVVLTAMVAVFKMM